jgi:hypothetical protein
VADAFGRPISGLEAADFVVPGYSTSSHVHTIPLFAVTPASAKGTTKACEKKGAPKAKTGAKLAAKTAPTSRNETASKLAKSAAKPRKPEARDGSKKGAVIELLRRKEG